MSALQDQTQDTEMQGCFKGVWLRSVADARGRRLVFFSLYLGIVDVYIESRELRHRNDLIPRHRVLFEIDWAQQRHA